MEDFTKNSDISELEEHDYMDDTYDELKSEYNTEMEFNDGKKYVDENFWEKVERVGKKISFAKDIRALFNYFSDKNIPWYRKSIVLGALIYFIVPIDAIPDISPLIGYLDDLGVITAVIKYLGSELVPYYDK